MPDIDIGLLSPTAAQANDAMVVRRGVDPTETVALVDLADFATAAQGALADSAVQPGDLAAVATSGSASDLGAGTLPVARIADASLALSKLANLATSTILGRATAGTGVPEALSAAQVRTIINVADGATANATDAFLLARANHTGTQAASTITGLAAVATSGSASDLSAGTLPAARLPAFGSGDVSFASGGGAGTVASDAVTNAKLANMPANTVKVNATASTADPADLSVGANTVVGRVAGNIVAAQLVAAQVADGTLTNAKLASMATATIKGRTTAGSGAPEDLTATQATAILDTFTSGAKGLAPASGGGTTNFLRADGTWAAPPGGGGGVSDGDKGDITVSASGATWRVDPNVKFGLPLAMARGLQF